MADVMGPLGRHLATIPIDGGLVAGPTFEPVDLGPDPSAALSRLAVNAIAADPAIAAVALPLRDEAALAVLA
jgi:hypothetical protein